MDAVATVRALIAVVLISVAGATVVAVTIIAVAAVPVAVVPAAVVPAAGARSAAAAAAVPPDAAAKPELVEPADTADTEPAAKPAVSGDEASSHGDGARRQRR